MAKATDNSPKINLDHALQTVNINNLPVDNTLVFNYFDKSVAAADYNTMMQKAIYIGVLALMEDRFSTFLSNTKNELGVQLESLKLIYDMKIKEFTETTKKGEMSEGAVYSFLQDFINANNFEDAIELTGGKAAKGKNKTGDILITLNEINKSIVIEMKLDGSVTLGDFTSNVDKFKAKTTDTAISQILESKYNRDSEYGMIVFDSSNVKSTISKSLHNGIRYYSGIGFVVIIDILSGDYKNLLIAYLLLREMAYVNSKEKLEAEWINLFVENLLNDFKNIISLKKDVDDIKKGLESSNKACDKLKENIDKQVVVLENHYNYFKNFISNSDRNSEEFFNYFTGKGLYKKLQEKKLEDNVE